MKKIYSLSLILGLLTLAFSSCSKDDVTITQTSPKTTQVTKQLTKMVVPEGTFTFSYNANNSLAGIVKVDAQNNSNTFNFVYNADGTVKSINSPFVSFAFTYSGNKVYATSQGKTDTLYIDPSHQLASVNTAPGQPRTDYMSLNYTPGRCSYTNIVTGGVVTSVGNNTYYMLMGGTYALQYNYDNSKHGFASNIGIPCWLATYMFDEFKPLAASMSMESSAFALIGNMGTAHNTLSITFTSVNPTTLKTGYEYMGNNPTGSYYENAHYVYDASGYPTSCTYKNYDLDSTPYAKSVGTGTFEYRVL